MNDNKALKWYEIGRVISSARHKLLLAKSGEEFQSIGLYCREAIISLGQFILELKYNGKLEGISKTDAFEIISRLISDELHGSSNENMRSYAKSCLALANELQHSHTANFAQSLFCIEATSSLFQLIRVLVLKDELNPDKRLIRNSFDNSEAVFIEDCIWENLNAHPVSKIEGFTITGSAYHNEFLTVHALFNGQTITATINRQNWWKGANRDVADKLLDELLVQLIAEKDKHSKSK